MAASAVQLRNALQGLGFTPDAATYIVDTQGYDTAADFAYLTNEQVENVCKVTRRPGGTGANGQGVNPGTPVSVKAENNLKLMCYYFRYKQRTSRTLVIPQATVANIRAYGNFARNEAEQKDPETPEFKTFGNWTRTIEVVEDHLRNCLGTTKIPLAYIIRDDVDPKPEADDPASDYTNYADELIARAPHYIGAAGAANRDRAQAYKDDNILVFNKLSEMFRDKDCWAYMQQSSRRRDGRDAFMRLKQHYLGKNNVDYLASTAERKLQNTTYTGETRRWNFEKYVQVHVNQHQILEDLTRHGYAGIDIRSKVRYLMDGIKTKELDNVKTQIMASATLRSDFDACVNLFQDFLKQYAKNEPRQISAIGRGPGGRDGYKGGKPKTGDDENIKPDMSIEDRYYTKEEYDRLTREQRKGLALKREKRGHKPGKKDSKVPKRARKSLRKRQVSAVTREKREAEEQSTSSDSSPDPESESESEPESDQEIPMKPPAKKKVNPAMNNRKNKALIRKTII